MRTHRARKRMSKVRRPSVDRWVRHLALVVALFPTHVDEVALLLAIVAMLLVERVDG